MTEKSGENAVGLKPADQLSLPDVLALSGAAKDAALRVLSARRVVEMHRARRDEAQDALRSAEADEAQAQAAFDALLPQAGAVLLEQA